LAGAAVLWHSHSFAAFFCRRSAAFTAGVIAAPEKGGDYLPGKSDAHRYFLGREPKIIPKYFK